MGKEIKRKKIVSILTICISQVLFLIGGMIYIQYREQSLIMFKWCKYLNIREFINCYHKQNNLPEWIIYSLPDGLWLLSYLLMISVIWKIDEKGSSIFILVLPFIAIMSEILQYFEYVKGTFDKNDLFSYIIAFIIGITYIKKTQKYHE